MAAFMKVGLIGLGKMGSRIFEKLRKEGHEVFAWNRSDDPLKNVESIKELLEKLDTPKIIWIMISAGGVDEVLGEVSKYIQKGDVVVDGGNSHYLDTERRFELYSKKGIYYLGIGTSGGILAEKNGYPFMVGGSKEGYEIIKPILDSLSKPNGGHQFFGKGGAGHFVKMVHNGIEYPMMQGLGEGFGVLASSEYKFDLLKVAKLFQKGTLVSGFMLDRTVEALEKDPKLSDVAGIIGSASGEALWTVEEAKKLDQPTESIEQAIDFRKRSEKDSKVQNSFAAKLVAALRATFGGHNIAKK